MGESAKAPSVVEVERDGIVVEVSLAYMRSWSGLLQAARMQDEGLSEAQRLAETVRYYAAACPNIGDVEAALSERAGGDGYCDANEVFDFVGAAVREATPKN